MLARPAREITELGGAENSFLRMRGKLRRSAVSGMLKDDPPMRGAMLALPITSSGDSRAENSLLRVRGNSDAPKGAACS